MAFTEKPKIKDYAKVGIVDYSNWECLDCGITGTGKAAFHKHKEECICKGEYERRQKESDEQEN